MTAAVRPASSVVYPDSDGMPMAENMTQYRWIVTIQGGLDTLLPDLVAGDNLIYPVEGRPDICQAPDVYVALGRPKGERGSYRVWEEGGVFPQVLFEIWSPSNRPREMALKRLFYEEHGAEEYYVYDPDRHRLTAYVRRGDELVDVPAAGGYTSPLLGIRFDMSGPELAIYRPDGARFLTFAEVHEAAATAREQADEQARRAVAERQRADAERQRADVERGRADAEKTRADALAAKLRALGLDPDAP